MIKKAVLLAGGHGTRLQPSTKVTNKHMLPIYSNQGAIPMVFYPIQTLVKSGIEDILIVSSKEHCGHIIENLGDGFKFGVDLTYKIQDVNRVPLGIASALKLAKSFTLDSNFAVILGDNFFQDTFEKEFEFFNKKAAIFIKQVKDPERFGVYADGNIEEKPSNPKSNMAVTGLYIYTPEVYSIAETLKVSKRNELEITDINQYYCSTNQMCINHIDGFWSDMGTPNSLVKTQEFISKNNFELFFS